MGSRCKKIAPSRTVVDFRPSSLQSIGRRPKDYGYTSVLKELKKGKVKNK
jgi:hypothetical protein